MNVSQSKVYNMLKILFHREKVLITVLEFLFFPQGPASEALRYLNLHTTVGLRDDHFS